MRNLLSVYLVRRHLYEASEFLLVWRGKPLRIMKVIIGSICDPQVTFVDDFTGYSHVQESVSGRGWLVSFGSEWLFVRENGEFIWLL